ncbi:response regulator [Caulobacter sp. DWR1-3-2b1]|uniref:response regulator n=1 Tax=Caulobacter sp. DWR1-3-2b1 TaxID=2804670 RepID=UPI003CF6C8E3
MLGHEVSQAASGQDGLSLLEAAAPYLLIVDFAMPGMNGVEVVLAVRRRWPELAIILATGYANKETVEKMMDLDQVLKKPFRIDDLDFAVRSALKTKLAG